MFVHPNCHEEYARRHNPIWPELQQVLRDHGVKSYSIFLDAHSSELFAYAEIESEERWEAIAKTEVCQCWWRFMQPLMKTDPDARPLAVELPSVFWLGSTTPSPTDSI